MSEINNVVSLVSAANIIAATGDKTTTILVGEPGIGKSSLRDHILSILGWGKDQCVYLDAPLLDFPDFYMPEVKDGMTSNAYHSRWHLDSDKPQLYMVDEIGKMSGVAKPMITRFLLERTVSDRPIPEGSIVFATSNLATDGVGDAFPAHMNNRVSTLKARKPDHEEVVEFGTKHGMNGTLIYFVRETPEVCQAYDELSAEELANNKYIFNPKTNTKQFVSNRSLWFASHALDRMEEGRMSKAETMAHIAGALGSAATAELWATVELADSLPTRSSIYSSPDVAKIPDNMAAQLLLAVRLSSGLGLDNAEATTKYMVRLEPEIQAVAGRLIFKSKPTVAMRSSQMREWVQKFTREYV